MPPIRLVVVQLGPLVAKKLADGRVLDQCVFELIAFAVAEIYFSQRVVGDCLRAGPTRAVTKDKI